MRFFQQMSKKSKKTDYILFNNDAEKKLKLKEQLTK